MKRRSPADTLHAALAESENAEECIVVMTNTEDDLIWFCTSDKTTIKIGLLRTTELQIAADMKTDVIEGGSMKTLDKLKIQ